MNYCFDTRYADIRLSIDGFSFKRVAQFNLEWIFSKLDSGFQSLVGFRILSAGFRIPKPRIPDSRGKKFLDSGIRIPLHGAIVWIDTLRKNQVCNEFLAVSGARCIFTIWIKNSPNITQFHIFHCILYHLQSILVCSSDSVLFTFFNI